MPDGSRETERSEPRSADAGPDQPGRTSGHPESTRGRVLAVAAGLAVLALVFTTLHGLFGTPGALPPATGSRSATATSDTWPMAGGGPGASRRTPAARDLHTVIAWQHTLDAAVATPPITDGRRLIIALTDGRLVALGAADGTPLWTFEGGARLWGAPTLAGDAVFLALRSGDVIAVDAASGAVRWRVATDGSFFTAPVVHAGVVYVHDQGDLFGLDAEDGRVLWAERTGARQSGSQPVVSATRLAIATSDEVEVYDRSTGARTYRYPQAQVVHLAMDGGQLLSVSPHFLTAADPATESFWWEGVRGVWTQAWLWGFASQPPPPPVLWYSDHRPTDVSVRVAAAEMLPPAVGPERVLVADASGLVRAFSRADGRLAWERRFAAVTGAPVAMPGWFVVPIRNGVTRLRASDGADEERIPLEPADARDVLVTDDRTYVVDRAGGITALR